MPAAARALVATALWGAPHTSLGEILRLDGRTAPGAYTLQGLAAFTLYALPDAPAWGKSQGTFPSVSFANLTAKDPKAPAGISPESAGLEVVLIKDADYSRLPGLGLGCPAQKRLQWPEGVPVARLPIPLNGGVASSSPVNITTTGIYYLLFANCENTTGAEIQIGGAVVVRNPFGFLTAIDFHKQTVYGWVSVTYVVLTIIWAGLCMTWQDELITIHAIVGVTISIGLIEAISWYFYLEFVNTYGEVADNTKCVMVMITVLKTYTAYTFVVVLSQGWRMTEETLDNCTLWKMAVVGLMWVLIAYMHEGAMANRHSFHIAAKMMVATAIAAFAANVVYFAWIFASLRGLKEGLRERGLTDQLKAVSTFANGLVVAAVLGCLGGALQIMDSADSLHVSWKYQFFADGGLPNLIHTGMVLVAMWAWMPSAGSGHMGYGGVGATEDQEDSAVWRDEADEEMFEGGNKVAPATVGAAASDNL